MQMLMCILGILADTHILGIPDTPVQPAIPDITAIELVQPFKAIPVGSGIPVILIIIPIPTDQGILHIR